MCTLLRTNGLFDVILKNTPKYSKDIALLRTNSDYSQNDIANKLQLIGVDLDKNAVQRIESGERFVTDIELKALAEIFNTTTEELLK